jgi:serine protease AprX
VLDRAPRMLRVFTALAFLAAPAVVSTSASAVTAQASNLDPALNHGSGTAQVIVSGRPGAGGAVAQAVLAARGTGLRPLPIIDGVSATVPASQLARLAASPAVTAVTANRSVQLATTSYDDSTSSSPYVWNAGATAIWQNAGTKGAGVSVAVLDTGVSAVSDLAGRVMAGPDLSGENNNAVDSYGHGTVMAGIIAGNGASSQPAPRTGVAPETQIISVKVAGANGSTDVSTVLAGLSWVGAFKDTYNIRVLNLSWGVPSTQDPRLDPLNYAVERLWTLGVTVVVAAGNSGPGGGTILKPGDDPLVLTTGAYDEHGDTAFSNDSVPGWSSRGPTAQGLTKPDLVAPGRTLVATRSPGSTVETNNPKALIAPAYIKGSGSSEATAVVSGLAALLVSAHPSWTPDQVKYALTSTALPISGTATATQGAGRVQGNAALSANVSAVSPAALASDASGSLNASRGTTPGVQIVCNGAVKVLNDETTSWCAPWDSAAWTSTAWTSTAWTSTAWTSTAWTSSAWTSTAWTSTAWTSTAWTSAAWTSTAWTSTAWTSSAWTGSAWTSATYDDAEFLSAFWGSRPPWWIHLPGEISDPRVGAFRDPDAQG